MKWYIWPTIDLYLALNNVSLSLLNLHSTFYSKRNFFFLLFNYSRPQCGPWSVIRGSTSLVSFFIIYLFIIIIIFLQCHSQPYKIKKHPPSFLGSTCYIVKSLCAPIKMSIYLKRKKKPPFVFYVRKWKLIKTKTSFPLNKIFTLLK